MIRNPLVGAFNVGRKTLHDAAMGVGGFIDNVAGDVSGRNAAESLERANQANIDFQKTLYDDQMRRQEQDPLYRYGREAVPDYAESAYQFPTRNPYESQFVNMQTYDPAQRYEYDQRAPSNQFARQEYQQPEFNFETDPGYQFRLQQGLDAVQGSAAARGGMLSTNTLKNMAGYAGNMASDEYGRAHGRYTDQRDFDAGQNRFGTQFDYGQMRDRRGDYEADRGFDFGAENMFANRQRDDYRDWRDFGYGQDRDRRSDYQWDWGQDYGQSTDRFNRLAALTGGAQTGSAAMQNLMQGYGQNMANYYGNQGNIGAGYANQRGQMWGNMLNQGLQLLPSMFGAGGR